MSMMFIVRDQDRLKDVLQALKVLNISRPMSVEIKEYRKNRSKSQNRLYWSWINVIANYTGDVAEELHEHLKTILLGTVHRRVMGEERILIRTTTSLSTGEFTEYLGRIELLAEKMQIRLPHPDDYRLAMYGEE